VAEILEMVEVPGALVVVDEVAAALPYGQVF
jgi:hypothetical protein